MIIIPERGAVRPLDLSKTFCLLFSPKSNFLLMLALEDDADCLISASINTLEL